MGGLPWVRGHQRLHSAFQAVCNCTLRTDSKTSTSQTSKSLFYTVITVDMGVCTWSGLRVKYLSTICQYVSFFSNYCDKTSWQKATQWRKGLFWLIVWFQNYYVQFFKGQAWKARYAFYGDRLFSIGSLRQLATLYPYSRSRHWGILMLSSLSPLDAFQNFSPGSGATHCGCASLPPII